MTKKIMKKMNLKIAVGAITFAIGIFAVALFTYRAFTTERISTQTTQSLEIKNPEQTIKPEDEVYLAVLRELFLRDSTKLLAVSDKTDSYANPEYLRIPPNEEKIQDLKKYHPEVPDETLRDYEMKMHNSSKLNFNFNFPISYIFINKGEVSEGKDGGIVAFSKKYPNSSGMIEFSAIGFNSEKTQAFVHVDFIYCPLCGFGSSLFLEKIDGNWKVIKNYEGWVS